MNHPVPFGKMHKTKSIPYTLMLMSTFLLISQLLSSCQSQRYGYLSKIRVKPNKEIKYTEQVKAYKTEATVFPSGELISACLESNPEIGQALPEAKALFQPEETSGHTKPKNNIQQQKKAGESNPKHKTQEPPSPDKHNIHAYIGAGFAALSLLSFLLSLSPGFEVLAFSSFLLSIPALILGLIGLSRYKKKKSKNGKILSLFAILPGIVFFGLVVLFIIFFAIFIISAGIAMGV